MKRLQPWTILVIVAALGGLFFASFSTYDFVAHLDRQVHGIHCSFIPGIEDTDATGSTGCHTTLMSPYSSVMRDSMWGGLPVSLPAMGVFAFLLFFAAALPILGRQRDPRATLFLMLGTLLPVLTSAVFGYLSLVTLDAACKLCIGIYTSSVLAFVGALMLWLRARKGDPLDETPTPAAPWGRLAVAFAVGVLFVMIPAGVYAAATPDFERYIGECGELAEMPSRGMLVALGPQDRDVGVVEVFDPLCPACRGFEQRFDAQEASGEVNRQVLLFPLDDECNWMVDDAIHAGACAISEAILCADDSSDVSVEDVIDWAFEHQEEIRTASEGEARAAAGQAIQRFPTLESCIGSPQVRARLNLGLRYAVDNQMPIITPQVFVNGTRMCDEDTDLGMDFALRRLIDKARGEGVRPPAPARDPLAVVPPPRPTKSGRPAIQLRPRTESDTPEVEAVLDRLGEGGETEAELEGADSDSDSDSDSESETVPRPEGEAEAEPEPAPEAEAEPEPEAGPGMSGAMTSMGMQHPHADPEPIQ